MKLVIEIELGNAAFEDAPGVECARILRELSDTLEHWGPEFSPRQCETLRDVNGNKVGRATVERSRD